MTLPPLQAGCLHPALEEMLQNFPWWGRGSGLFLPPSIPTLTPLSQHRTCQLDASLLFTRRLTAPHPHRLTRHSWATGPASVGRAGAESRVGRRPPWGWPRLQL